MFGAQIYIEQQFKNPWYSEVLFTKSVVAAGKNIAKIDYGEWGAKMILITAIIFTSAIIDGSAPFDFIDNFNRYIMTLKADPTSTGFYEVNIVLNAPGLEIQYLKADTGAIFSVQHQYLRETNESDFKR